MARKVPPIAADAPRLGIVYRAGGAIRIEKEASVRQHPALVVIAGGLGQQRLRHRGKGAAHAQRQQHVFPKVGIKIHICRAFHHILEHHRAHIRIKTALRPGHDAHGKQRGKRLLPVRLRINTLL